MSKMTITNRLFVFAGTAALSWAFVSGCAKKTTDGDGSESHFVACTSDAQCAELGANYRCVAERCKPGDANSGRDAGSGGSNGNSGASATSGANSGGNTTSGGAGGGGAVQCPPSPHYLSDAATDPPPSPPGFVDGGIYGCYPPRPLAPINWITTKLPIGPCPATSHSCTYAPTALPCGPCQLEEGAACAMGVAAICDCGEGPIVDTYDDQWVCKCEGGRWDCAITAPSGASCMSCSNHCSGSTPYSTGMIATGQSGIKVALVSDPEPPSIGDNTWTLTITDAGGAPITGASIGFRLFMPVHRHNGPRNPVVTEISGGVYRAEFVDFNMEGVWQTTITVEKAPIDDSVLFELCVL